MDLWAALATLQGLTTHEIVMLLGTAGITGQQRRCSHCPMAKYLQKLTGIPSIYVGSDFARDDTTGLEVILPEGAVQFRREFDAGRFEYLRSSHIY